MSSKGRESKGRGNKGGGNNDSRYRAEVDRRVADALRGAGVDEGRVAVEILYLLPREFVREYEELYHKAHGTEQTPMSGGADGRSYGYNEAKVKADKRKIRKDEGAKDVDGKRRGDQGLKTRSSRGVGSSVGKGKFKEDRDGPTARIRDEQALEVKTRVDRRLRGLVRSVEKLMEGSQGEIPGGFRMLKNGRKVCRDCGKLMRDDFVRCPYPHA